MTQAVLRALGDAFDKAATTCHTKEEAARRIEQMLRAAGFCITPLVLPSPLVAAGYSTVRAADWHEILFEIELRAERTPARPTLPEKRR